MSKNAEKCGHEREQNTYMFNTGQLVTGIRKSGCWRDRSLRRQADGENIDSGLPSRKSAIVHCFLRNSKHSSLLSPNARMLHVNVL